MWLVIFRLTDGSILARMDRQGAPSERLDGGGDDQLEATLCIGQSTHR